MHDVGRYLEIFKEFFANQVFIMSSGAVQKNSYLEFPNKFSIKELHLIHTFQTQIWEVNFERIKPTS